MSTKQFAVFMLCLIFVFTLRPTGAQSGLPIMIPAQTSIANCAWPTSYVTVQNGLAICPLNLTTGPALAIAVNGGAFTQIPMTPGQSVSGSAPIVVTGGVISCPTCVTSAVTSLNGKTGALNLSATSTAPTVTVTAQ